MLTKPVEIVTLHFDAQFSFNSVESKLEARYQELILCKVYKFENTKYQHFKIDPNSVRDGCEPRIILHEDSKVMNTIVLVHGLTDSPYFIEAIGKRFYDIGFNVLIPLLAGHGLKEPRGMKGVIFKQWIDNVDFAVKKAIGVSQLVSIGGL